MTGETVDGLRVLVVTSYGDHTALTGGRLRRDNVVRGLRDSGHVVDRLDVPARPGPRSAARAAAISLSGDFRARVRSADAVYVGDVFCLPMLPVLRGLRVPVLVDLVDSPYRLVGSAPRSTLRERVSAVSQDLQLVPVMQWLLPMADAVTYISAEDVEADAARVSRLPRPTIVPNGIHEQLLELGMETPPADGYLAWLADWVYPPNRESLWWFVHEVAPHLPDDALERVRLFGHGDPFGGMDEDDATQRAAATVQRGGFVDDLAEVYAGSRAVIAPVTRGAGMNNKVLEPLAAGRQLVTTPVGTRGLAEEIRAHVRVADDGPGFAEAVIETLGEPWSAPRAEEARRSVATMSWQRSATAMDAALRELVARDRAPRR